MNNLDQLFTATKAPIGPIIDTDVSKKFRAFNFSFAATTFSLRNYGVYQIGEV